MVRPPGIALYVATSKHIRILLEWNILDKAKIFMIYRGNYRCDI